MNWVKVILLRPIGIVLLSLALILCGLLCWRLLPVAPLPQMDVPMISVTASLPGASPQSMASTVATPLERSFGSISGITAISSASNQGSTQVALMFELDRDLNEAAREVQAAINAARDQLPSGMPNNPQFSKVDPSQAPIMGLALSSDTLTPSELYDVGSTILAQKLAQITGVGEVAVDGASLPAVRVQLNPGALLQYGIALDEVRSAISRTSVIRPMGTIENDKHRWQVQTSDPEFTAAAYRDLIIRENNGAVVRLGDVATVTDSVENKYSSGFHNDRQAVILTINRKTGANIVATIDNINNRLPHLKQLIPSDADLTVVMDRSPVIRATLKEAEITLMIACILVMLVVWVFLGNFRSALIPSLAIPVSLIGAYIAMYFFGFSLNNLSVMALIVAAGIVVDDAIVVQENVERQLAYGSTPLQATLKSYSEVGFTLVAMTATLATVFLSILFSGGIVTQLFREFSITLVAATVISLLAALTLIPSLCATWIQPKTRSTPSKRDKVFAQLDAGYKTALGWMLRFKPMALVIIALALAASVNVFNSLQQQALPDQDTGQIRGFIRGDDGFSFQVMQPKIEIFRQYILQDPAVEDLTGTSGGNGGLTNGQINIKLKPLAERKVSAQDVADRINANAPLVPGAMMRVSVDQDLNMRPRWGRSEYEVVLRSDSLTELKKWAIIVAQAMEQSPLLEDIDNVDGDEARQVVLDIDREAAGSLGVDMQNVASVLSNSFSQRQVATLYDELNQYRVVMELEPRFTAGPETLGQIEVLTGDGSRVPLSTFAKWTYGMAEDRIRHEGQFASMGIGYGVAPGVTTVAAEEEVDRILNQVMLPTSVHQAPPSPNDLNQGMKDPWLFVWVILAVYLILGVLYESTLHPVTILSTIPPAGLGALVALKLTGQDLSLIALLGLFLLIGVVMKNAIMMIDFALSIQRQENLAPRQAIEKAALLRLRPILMTNLAGMLGAIPLIVGAGDGAEMRQPLGIAIFGGLALSQLMTLFTTPVVYLYLETLRQAVSKRFKTDAEQTKQPESL
ncbi:efflux RND transporter permease subunit [Halioxenophilus aromaticivorans]|uniref:Efflux RND transporter permease subunit n=1 Tax=Halioxenophilus aromaticivorans TaxID=1306992 RepID=A0AAV3U705_9ALTE